MTFFRISVPATFWWSFGAALVAFSIAAIILWGPFLRRWIGLCWHRTRFLINRIQPKGVSIEDQNSFPQVRTRTVWSKLNHFRKHFWFRITIFVIVCISIAVFSMASMVSFYCLISQFFNRLHVLFTQGSYCNCPIRVSERHNSGVSFEGFPGLYLGERLRSNHFYIDPTSDQILFSILLTVAPSL